MASLRLDVRVFEAETEKFSGLNNKSAASPLFRRATNNGRKTSERQAR